MPVDHDKASFVLLLLTLGIFFVLSVVQVVQGDYIAVIPLVVQLLVLGFVVGKLPGAVWVVRGWAALLVLGAVAYWLSVALQVFAWAIYPEGGPFAERVTKLTLWIAFRNTAFLGLGWFFIRVAPRLVSRKAV